MAGASALIYCSVALIDARAAQREAAGFGNGAAVGAQERTRVDPAEDVHEAELPSQRNLTGSGAVVGRIDIPKLGLSAPITDGTGKDELLRGVGHVPGTALAGGLGTMGLAGHRDTFFRPLKNVARGMDIRVSDATGAFHYRVDSTEIVQPERVEVLDIRSRPELTLITCYPFNFVGAAPKRFIVHASLVSAAADQ